MTPPAEKRFTFSQHIEKLFAVLSKYYNDQNKSVLGRILVNSEYSLDENVEYNDWNEGSWGHRLNLLVSPEVFAEVMNDLSANENLLRTDINRIARVDQEYIDAVSIKIADADSFRSWREQSGLLLRSQNLNIGKHLWNGDYFRVFLSHKSDFKVKAAELKDIFLYYGVSAFVAHEDIEPSKAWEKEIELALHTMDACVPLLTSDFSESNWTDQEIGFALGQGIPVIPVRLGKDPYGFIGKIQAVTGNPADVEKMALDLVNAFFTSTSLHERLLPAFVTRLEKSGSFAQSNMLMEYIIRIKLISPLLLKRLANAPKNNYQVREATTVRVNLPTLLSKYGYSE